MPKAPGYRLGWLLAAALGLAGCTAPPAPGATCAMGRGAPMALFELFFGRSLHGQGEVTDADWQRFRDAVVTPNLPDGYTSFDAEGAWREPHGTRTIHERTKVLQVALPDTDAAGAAITRVRRAYEQEFRQESVGMVVTQGCGEF